MTFCEFSKNPVSFVGKRIRLHAVYVYGFEVQLLKSPDCCVDVEPKVGIQWQLAGNSHSESLFRKLDKNGMGVALVTLVGSLEHVKNVSSQLPSGDRFQLDVEEIERVEKSAKRHGKRNLPAWARKDCVKGRAASPSKTNS